MVPEGQRERRQPVQRRGNEAGDDDGLEQRVLVVQVPAISGLDERPQLITKVLRSPRCL